MSAAVAIRSAAISQAIHSFISSHAGTDAAFASWPRMKSPEDLLRDAEEAERLAALVSYAPDKRRLLEKAAELREQAKAAAEAPGKRTRPR